jgi:DNA-binding GntR family transcriptional regulator
MLLNVVEQADSWTADALELEARSRVQHIRTVVHADGDPFTVIDAYSADTLDRRMAEADFVVPVPSANAMGERLGRRIARAEQELDAVAADKVAATALRVPVGTPIIRARRVYYAIGDQAIQYLIVRYHPDHYRFIVDLIPRSGTSAFTAMPHPTCKEKKARKGKR